MYIFLDGTMKVTRDCVSTYLNKCVNKHDDTPVHTAFRIGLSLGMLCFLITKRNC